MLRYVLAASAALCLAAPAGAAGVIKGVLTDPSGSLTFNTASPVGGSPDSNVYVTVRFSEPLDSVSLAVQRASGLYALTQIGPTAWRGYYNEPTGNQVYDLGQFVNLTYSYSSGNPVSYSVRFMGDLPEPSTWLMMLLGFGAIGFALRRNRPLALGVRAAARVRPIDGVAV